MLDTALYILISITAAALGIVFSYFYLDRKKQQKIEQLKSKNEKLIEKAKAEAQKLSEETKSYVESLKKELVEELSETERRLQSYGDRLKHKEEVTSNRLKNVEKEDKKLDSQKEEIEEAKKDIEKLSQEQIRKLEEKTGLKREQAKQELISKYESQTKDDVFTREQKVKMALADASEEAARNIVTSVSQRLTDRTSREATSYIFNLKPSEIEKLIGEKGKTIRLLEDLTKAEMLFDDNNRQLYVGGYNLVNRTVAQLTVDKILKKRKFKEVEIKNFVKKAKDTVSKKMIELGEKTVEEFGIKDFDPKLVKLIGRLFYRTSFGQNILRHAREVTFFAVLLASELGADIEVCKRAGLLHDIGKAVDTEIEGAHDELTKEICQKFGISEEVTFAAYNHHEKEEFTTVESRIIQIADAISASRPGARQESLDKYLERLEQLEKVSNEFPGVEKAFAIQAGREVRVMVNPEEISDEVMSKLAREIADKIENEVVYPGEVEVNLSRETKSTEFAR